MNAEPIRDDLGLLAQVADDELLPRFRAYTRYTAFVSFEGEIEEVDVDAVDLEVAKLMIQRELDFSYVEGGVVLEIAARQGLYF